MVVGFKSLLGFGKADCVGTQVLGGGCFGQDVLIRIVMTRFSIMTATSFCFMTIKIGFWVLLF